MLGNTSSVAPQQSLHGRLSRLPFWIGVLDVLLERLADLANLRIGEVLYSDKLDPRVIERTNDLVEFGLNCGSIPVLAVLDKEHGKECQDCRSGVDDELPGVRIV